MKFTQESLDFLFENRVMDSRLWFEENREKYIKLVKEPTIELITEIGEKIIDIDPLMITRPSRCLSRIRRDTRFTHDKSLYRDVVWVVFMRDKKLFTNPPAFYFEYWPGGFRYGCGNYGSDTTTMSLIRQLILENSASFKKAKRCLDKQDTFKLEGDMYKRSRHKDQPDSLKLWLDRKNIYAVCNLDSPDILFSDNLSDILADGFRSLEPFYKFLVEAGERRLIKEQLT